MRRLRSYPLLLFAGALLGAILTGAYAPLEKTLGTNARLVYIHGAWVWAAMLAYLAAGLSGAAALVVQKERLSAWSLALGRTGLLYWLAFLPMSLWVMQANWNGLYLDEPRFRIPLNFAIVSLLLQVGLSFFPAGLWSNLANLGFAIALFAGMNGIQTVLHPDSPILSSGARGIQIFFAVLVFLLAVSILGMAQTFIKLEAKRSQTAVVQAQGMR